MALLKRHQKRSLQQCFGPGTIKNLRHQWKSFIAFTKFFKLKTLPSSHNTLALHSQLLSRTFSSPDSIRNYISGVKTLHKLLQLPTHQFDHPHLTYTLLGLQRQLQHLPKRASPITLEILSKFHTLLDLSDDTHLVFWALFLTAFFSMARKSNLVPTPGTHTPDHFVRRSDIEFFSSSAVLTFKTSKTNQFSARIHPVPLFKTNNNKLCPVTALQTMISRIPAPLDSPLFLLPNKKPLTYHMFNNNLKHLIKLIGLKPTDFSSHSFRRGGATIAFQAQVEPELIKYHGDWKSDAYLVYLEYNFA